MARTDYLDDPAAPKANSIVPAVSVVVPDDQGRILLIRRTDNNYWSIPGGGMEPGESVRRMSRMRPWPSGTTTLTAGTMLLAFGAAGSFR